MKNLMLIALCVVFLSTPIFGQEQELDKHFKKVEVIKIDIKDILKKVSERKPVKIGKFDLNLEYTEIRSKDFQSKETSKSGTDIVEPVRINTVKGTVLNQNSSHVRMTIDDSAEGYINTSGESFYLERADKYDPKLSTDSFVVYKHQDKKTGNSFVCVADKLKEEKQAIDSKALALVSDSSLAMSSQPNKVLRLATDADHEYFTANGSSQAATNYRILSILNMVQGMYFAELDIDLQVVFQNVWVNPDNYQKPKILHDIPCFNEDTQQWGLCLDEGVHLLEDFAAYWNAPNPSLPIANRDAVHLFTDKNVGYGGLAYVREVCSAPQSAYGWTKYYGTRTENGVLLESNIAAHEIGHNLGADHTPPAFPRPQFPNELTNQENCFNRDSDAFKREMPFFCPYTKNQMLSHIASVPNCLLRTGQSPPAPVKQSFDFDGDTKANLAAFRSAAFAEWHVKHANGDIIPYQYGTIGDIPVAADYDGDRRTDLAVFRPQYTSTQSAFFLRRSTLDRISIYWGAPGDIPVQGDYDGDERTDVAVFRPSNGGWYIYNVFNGQQTSYAFGQSEDVPVQADYDGDGKTDIGVFRPSTGYWYIQRSSAGFYALAFGQSGDFFVPADYDGDRKMDIAVYRASTGSWYIQQSSQGYTSIVFSNGTDSPIVGDYDGDGKADQAFELSSLDMWSIRNSSTGQITYPSTNPQMNSGIPIGFRNPQ